MNILNRYIQIFFSYSFHCFFNLIKLLNLYCITSLWLFFNISEKDYLFKLKCSHIYLSISKVLLSKKYLLFEKKKICVSQKKQQPLSLFKLYVHIPFIERNKLNFFLKQVRFAYGNIYFHQFYYFNQCTNTITADYIMFAE